MNWRVLAVLFGSLGSVCVVGVAYYVVLTSTPTVHAPHNEDALLISEGTLASEAAPNTVASSSVIDTSAPQDSDESEQAEYTLPIVRLPTTAPPFPQEDEQSSRNSYPIPAPSFPKLEAPHTHDGVLTVAKINTIKLTLKLSPDQEPYWQAVARPLRELSQEEMKLADAGQKSVFVVNSSRSARLSSLATPLINSLRDDQQQGARELAHIMGFKSLAALTDSITQDGHERKMGATAPSTLTKPVTDAAPPVQRLVLPKIDHRYDQALTSGEIARFKTSLRLTPDQERLWPQIDTILRELGQQQIAQVDAGQTIQYGMSGAMIQRFYAAASPLLATLRDDQKDEIRRRARILGLEAYASYL